MNEPSSKKSPRRRGRPTGPSRGRSEIVAAAAEAFTRDGYSATSLRAVARGATVDPALVHHHFPDGKPALFIAAMELPRDPTVAMAHLTQIPRSQVGQAMVETFLAMWSDSKERFITVVSGVLTEPSVGVAIRQFISDELLRPLVQAHNPTFEQAEVELRCAAAASQLLGLGVMKFGIAHPALVDASPQEIVTVIGPALQQHVAPL